MALCYGKRPPKAHPLTLKLAKYLAPGALPPPPVKRAWEYSFKGDWGMLGNDTVGDCVIAMVLHYIMAAAAANGQQISFTTDQAISLYSAITGYDPSDPSTDQGTVMTDALAYWLKNGIYGHTIRGWASFDHTSLMAHQQAIALFGGSLVGLGCTPSMVQQFSNGQPWNSPFTGPPEGHGVPWLGYGREGQTCITWEKPQQMDQNAVSTTDESYVVISDDWLNAVRAKTPSGLDLPALEADIQAISA